MVQFSVAFDRLSKIRFVADCGSEHRDRSIAGIGCAEEDGERT